MKWFIFLGVFVITFSIFADIPNYTGTWVLDESKVEDNGQRRGRIANKITVVHQDNEFTTERLTSNSMRGDITTKEHLTLDGKECIMETGVGPRTSTAIWSEEQSAILINSKMVMKMGGDDYQINFYEAWAIEPDGSLKIDSKRTSPRGERHSVYFYIKKE